MRVNKPVETSRKKKPSLPVKAPGPERDLGTRLRRALSDNVPTGHVGRWFRKLLGLDRRWGIRFNKGNLERTGFYTRAEAEGWMERQGQTGVAYFYDPIDLRILDDEKDHANHKTHFVGDSQRPRK